MHQNLELFMFTCPNFLGRTTHYHVPDILLLKCQHTSALTQWPSYTANFMLYPIGFSHHTVKLTKKPKPNKRCSLKKIR